MAQVRIRIADARNEGLPPICMCCGAPAARYQRHQFIWIPWWARIFGLLGTWFFWRAKIDGPLCHAHRHHWKWRWVVPLCLLVLGIAAAAGSYIFLDITRGKPAAAAWQNTILLSAGIAFVVWSILFQFLRHTGVHPVHMDDRSITLTGVADAFADAIENPVPPAAPIRAPIAKRAIVAEVLPDDDEDVLDVPLPLRPPPHRKPPR